MKIVVTGGAGFIGSHIVEFWNEQEAEVHVIDNYRTGCLENISGLHGVVMHEGTVTDREFVKEVCEGADYIFNLAAMVSVPESLEKPDECIFINVQGLINVLEAAKEFKVKKVINSSTAAVYGNNPIIPKTTNMLPSPNSPYGVTKLSTEYYCSMYHEQFGVKTASLRYFNVYGPRQSAESAYAAAVPIFIEKALKGDPITIYGDGLQTRDFIFVKDVVRANVNAAMYEDAIGVFNVAFGDTVTIKELAIKIQEMLNSKSDIVYKDERPGDIRYSRADISDTSKKLGFVPEYNLEIGLEKTLEYFKSREG